MPPRLGCDCMGNTIWRTAVCIAMWRERFYINIGRQWYLHKLVNIICFYFLTSVPDIPTDRNQIGSILWVALDGLYYLFDRKSLSTFMDPLSILKSLFLLRYEVIDFKISREEWQGIWHHWSVSVPCLKNIYYYCTCYGVRKIIV